MSNHRTSYNWVVIIGNYLWYNLYLYEYFFAKGNDSALWKGLFYFTTSFVIGWFVREIFIGFSNPKHKETVLIYLTSISGLFLLFGLSYLYVIKEHPVLYFILFNGTTWNIALFNLLNGLRFKILNHEYK